MGIEPRAFRMQSGCDTTTPCAQRIVCQANIFKLPFFTVHMDTLGIEPRAFRMRSGCDTTTPCAPLLIHWNTCSTNLCSSEVCFTLYILDSIFLKMCNMLIMFKALKHFFEMCDFILYYQSDGVSQNRSIWFLRCLLGIGASQTVPVVSQRVATFRWK